jgi:hypothetical protein
MPRKSLRPELNRIRGWVRQGRTDAWIAHQLEVTVQQIQAFKREQALEPGAEPATVDTVVDFDDEIDLRAEDDALIAAQLDAEAEAKAIADKAAAEQAAAKAEDEDEDEDGADAETDADGKPKPRRRGRRGGRSTRRKKPVGPLEGTFDHGEEGYGLWLDPSIQDDPVYAEHWAGHRPVEVAVEEDQIIIRRISADAEIEESEPAEAPAED